METKIAPSASVATHDLIVLRAMPQPEWIERYASGTLRKSTRLGMNTRMHYLNERAAFEFGYGFEVLPTSRVLFGVVQAEGDCKAITELGWHCERLQATRRWAEDEFEPKYIVVDDRSDFRREGVGIVVWQTSADWVPRAHLVFAITCEWDLKLKRWAEPENPA